MLLNSNQASEHIIESEFSKRTQAGIDLSVFKIEKIELNTDKIPLLCRDKTIIDKSLYLEIKPDNINQNNDNIIGWMLKQGIYSVTFNEGIKVPADCMAKITHRSSLWRIGNLIETPWFDAGYSCNNINTTLIINIDMFIEFNSRLCQVIFYRMEKPAESLYDGQWNKLDTAYKP